DDDVAGRPPDRRRTPLCRGPPALESRTLVHERFLHVQIVDVHRLARLLRLHPGVGHGGPQRLVDALGGALLRELEQGVGLADAPPADEVDDQPHLARALPDVLADRTGFHDSPTWPWSACPRASR